MKKLLLLIFSLVTLAGYSQTTLSANPDTFTVIQARVDTFAVTLNDSIPLGDSVCITLLDTVHFSVLGCASIIYHPDSAFTGRDTCRYIACDGSVCDSSMVVVYVRMDTALYLPVASFKEDTTLPGSGGAVFPQARLFTCNHVLGYTVNCVTYRLVNTSLNYDSISWAAHFYSNHICHDSIGIFFGDTILFDPNRQQCIEPDSVLFCLTAFNRFGSTTSCQMSCYIDICEGISEVPLTHVSIYPTPASQTLIIDMSQNTDDISSHYTAIDLYNAIGQKVRTISKQNNNKIVNVPVAILPDGIYLATISDATHTERMLGKFTITQ